MDDLIEAYQSLRALLEDIVASWPDGVEGESDSNRQAIRAYLRTHCRECGAVIPEELRRKGETRCRWCGRPPQPALRRGIEGEDSGDEVPFR